MNEAALLARGATRDLWFGNTRVAIRVSAAEGEDEICVIEHWMPEGEAPPLHIHHSEDEIFHVIEGRMRIRIAGREVIAGPGDTILAPRGIPHGFRVESPAGARCLTVTCGRDFETMVREVGRPARMAGLPPFQPVGPAGAAQLIAACARHAIEVIGAPIAGPAKALALEEN